MRSGALVKVGRRFVQTAEHILIHCTNLAKPRRRLLDEVGHMDYHTFLTKDVEAATAWMICYGNVEMFENVREDHKFWEREQNGGWLHTP